MRAPLFAAHQEHPPAAARRVAAHCRRARDRRLALYQLHRARRRLRVLCSFISNLIGVTVLGVTYQPTYGQALISASGSSSCSSAASFVMALILGYLAPLFGGHNNRLSALEARRLRGDGRLAGQRLPAHSLARLPHPARPLFALPHLHRCAGAARTCRRRKALPFTARRSLPIGIVTTRADVSVSSTAFRSARRRRAADAQRHAAEIERRLNAGTAAVALRPKPRPSRPSTEQRTAEAPPPRPRKRRPRPGGGFGAPRSADQASRESVQGWRQPAADRAGCISRSLLPFDLPGGFKRTETLQLRNGDGGHEHGHRLGRLCQRRQAHHA